MKYLIFKIAPDRVHHRGVTAPQDGVISQMPQ